MINLIKNEFIKLLKRKNILIMLMVALGFILLTNIIYKKGMTNSYVMYGGYYTVEYRDSLKQTLNELDPKNPSDVRSYIETKVEYETANLVLEYGNDSWQTNIIQSQAYSLFYDLYNYQYEENNPLDSQIKEKEAKIATLKEKLRNNEWKYFVQEEMTSLEAELKSLNDTKLITKDTKVLEEIESSIKYAKISLEVVNYRLDKDIDYSSSYLNDALNNYQMYKHTLISYDGQTNLSYNEKLQIQDAQEYAALAKYSLDNEYDIYKQDSSREILLNVMGSYQIIILFMIIMIAGGIVADEFSKGTIKLLLIKPYERTKILLAKYITSLLMVVISVFIIYALQFVIGGIFFGFDSLSIPAVLYNFNTNTIQSMNIFMMILLNFVQILPYLVLLMTLAFTISTVFTSAALAISLPLVGAFIGDLINMLAIQFNIEFIKFFVTPNWNLAEFMFGRLPSFQYTNLALAIIVCIFYWIMMLTISFVVFKKKNIKNI